MMEEDIETRMLFTSNANLSLYKECIYSKCLNIKNV